MSQITTYVDGAGGAITTVTGNVGGAVSPDAAGDIGFTGAGYLTVTGTPGSNSLEVSLDSNAAITAIQGWNGAIVESPVATVASDGTTITLSVERSGTGDLTVVFSDGFYDWDTTPAATVTLTAGSDTAPQLNYIYFDKATKTLLSSTVSWPSTEHAPIATVLCQSAASLQTDGSYKVHAWTDHVKASNDSGHIGHLNYWIRYQNATWRSGVTPTLTITTQGAAPDDVIFTSSSGSVLQLHDHAFPTFSGTPDMYVVNDSTTAYDKITNMNTILTDSTGATLSARYFSLVVWGVVSEAGADCKLMVNLPGGSYGNASTLDADLSKYADFSIPSDFKGTGFLIAQINLRHQTISSGTWTLLDTIDLRGLYPSLSAGGATAAATEFEDNVFRILDEGDNTKKIAFEVSGVTTGTVRTITMDDRDIDLDAVPDQFATDSGTATPAAGIATIAGGDTIVTSGAGSTVTVDTTGALKTDSGFEAWTGTGNYFDDTVIGTFQILRGGSGYIKGVPVSFTGPQSVTGLITGEVYWIYIDNTGTLQKTTTRTHSLYEENIVLFICARDSTSPTNVQITVKENHPFGYPVRVSNYNHDVVGTVISNINNGANITLNGTQKIQINGSDELANHGLYTTISDSSGVAESFYQVYTLATGKWAIYASSDTFTGYYNNAGTPTVLGASKYGVYTLYAGKDSLNTATPRYVAILDTSEYSNLSAAQTAIANGATAAKANGLLDLEITQLGYIVYQKSTDTIVDVIIAKATVQQCVTTSGTNVASLVTTSTTNFDGILSAGDTNVQASLETIDEWGKSTTDHSLLIGNGTGSAIGSLGVATDGQLVIGSTGADPTLATLTAGTGISITDASGSITITNTSASGLTINSQTSDYTLVLTDNGKFVSMNDADPLDVTVPLNSSVAFPTGTELFVYQEGAGAVSILPTTGVTINSGRDGETVGARSLREKFSVVKLVKTDTDSWSLSGDIIEQPELTWTNNTSSPTTDNIGDIAYGKGIFILIAEVYGAYIYTTTDPTSGWTSRPHSLTELGRAIAYDGSTYFTALLAIDLMTSLDGITWTQQTDPFGTSSVNDIGYSSDLSMWIVVGYTGKIFTASDPTSTWTPRSSGTTERFSSVETGNNLVVAVGADGTTSVTSNGTSWTTYTHTAWGSDDIKYVEYGNGIWVYVGTNNRIHVGSDPTDISSFSRNTNIPSSIISTNTWLSVTYSEVDDLWTALGGSDIIITTKNPYGVWTLNTITSGFSGGNSVVANGYCVATGTAGAIVTAPMLNSIDLTNGVKDVLPVFNGGTGASSITDHGVVIGSDLDALSVTAVGATNQVLLGNTGADPTWGAVDLATDITGTLDVANGGTGATTLTDHGILLGNATGSVTATAELSNGQLAIGSTGNVPTLATLTEGAGIDITNAAGSVTIANLLTLNNQTGTTYTTVLNDSSKYITMTNAAASTLTIPPNSSVAYPIGTTIYVQQLGAGQVTLTPGSGVTFRSADDAYKLAVQYSGCSLIKILSDTWGIMGDVST